MKRVLIPVSVNFFARNFLMTEALASLAGKEGLEIVILAPEGKVGYYEKNFSCSNFIFDRLPRVGNSKWENFFKFIETASIPAKTVTILQFGSFYRRGSKDFFPKRFFYLLAGRFLWFLGHLNLWRKLIRIIYYLISDESYKDIFEKYKPDLVFCPSTLGLDNLFLKEAKRRGIKTAAMVVSWDNLYSKSLLRVHPDKLIVHTEKIARQCVEIGDYPRERIEITGVPQYDRYFLKHTIESREDFFKKIGADPAKKLILYAFSGKAGLNIESEIIKLLHESIANGRIEGNVQVLIRPYPRFDFPSQKLLDFQKKYGFLACRSVAHFGNNEEAWEFDEQSADLAANSLAHADLVITMYSTYFIEAAIFDKPLIGVCFDGEKRLDFWNSASRFFEWDHLRDIKILNGIKLSRNKEEFIQSINKYLKNPGLMSDGRKRIVKQQCQFEDGMSGRRVAQALISCLGE